MKLKSFRTTVIASAFLINISFTQAQQASQVNTGVTAEIPRSISIPDKVSTSIGTLDFFDGAPTGNTVKAVYENLDRTRSTSACTLTMLELYLSTVY